jgi:hypothetical protein
VGLNAAGCDQIKVNLEYHCRPCRIRTDEVESLTTRFGCPLPHAHKTVTLIAFRDRSSCPGHGPRPLSALSQASPTPQIEPDGGV